ncbi:MAG: M24 family metallopeptidase [Microgenomates group bacterium]
MSKYTARILALSSKLHQNQAFLITNTQDMLYFAGFETLVPNEREGYVLVTQDSTYVIHASFTPVSKLSEITYLIGCTGELGKKNLSKIVTDHHISTLFADYNSLSVAEYKNFSEVKNLQIKEIEKDLLASLRMVKDESEQKLIRSAGRISAEAFDAFFSKLEVGLTEMQVKHLLEHELRVRGADQTAFPTIVAFGAHTALPHYQPSSMKLAKNMPVMIDFGAKFEHYCSDMTRTFWFGPDPDAGFSAVEAIVKTAYNQALEYLKDTDITHLANGVDDAARSVIAQAGYGKQFIHTTGHGLGLDIHESPSLNWTNTQEIVPGMVITIEPGIYLEGKFGIRYENSVLITENEVVEVTLLS